MFKILDWQVHNVHSALSFARYDGELEDRPGLAGFTLPEALSTRASEAPQLCYALSLKQHDINVDERAQHAQLLLY